jgi:hypothetical protein
MYREAVEAESHPSGLGNAIELAILMWIFQAGIHTATTPGLASAKVGEESISASGASFNNIVGSWGGGGSELRFD